MKRQGLLVDIDQLRKLADELEKEVKDNEKKYKVSGWGTKFQINIINKTPECSDTWTLEDFDEFVKRGESKVSDLSNRSNNNG